MVGSASRSPRARPEHGVRRLAGAGFLSLAAGCAAIPPALGAQAASAAHADMTIINIQLRASGPDLWNGTPVDDDKMLARRLKRLHSVHPGAVVNVRPVSGVPYTRLYMLAEMLQSAGFTVLGLPEESAAAP